jgi:translation initiation factor 5A
VQIPNVARTDYNLLNISEDGFLDLMMDNGDTREDLTLPEQTEEDKKLGEQVRTDFAAGKELVLSVLKAMDDEKIIAAKVNT